MKLKTVLLLALLCAPAFAQMTPVQGNITAASSSCLSTNCVTLQLDGQTGAASIQLTGTFTATVSFEVSNDNGTTYVAVNGTPPNSTTAVSSATATGLWQFNVAGFTHIRARGSAYTSGTAAVVINSARVSAKSGGGTSLPALSDNGTIVTSTEPILVPAGTITSPSIQWAESTANAGWFRAATNVYDFSIGNSTVPIRFANNTNTGNVVVNTILGISTNPNSTNADLFLRRRGAANFQLGAPDLNGTPVDQTISVQNAITGSNLPGGHLTIDAPVGTGLGAASKTCLNRALMGATGATAQSATNGFCVGESKTLSNTTATTTALANISVPSNSSGGSSGSINVSCNDGTNFDSETVSFVVSYVNKATALTIGTVQLTTASTANNSGSCTTAVTATAGTNSVNINVTPVITTIVPTTTTGTVLSLSSYATGNVTIN